MSNGFIKLQETGAQAIHEKTHITKEHVQAILHDSFEGMNKIQFLGFVSILERDYDVDLSDLKIRGLEYFLNLDHETIDNGSVFIEQKKKVNMTPYIVTVLLVVVIAAFFIFNKTFYNGKVDSKAKKIDNTNIENSLLQKSKPVIEVNETTQDKNESEIVVQEAKQPVVVQAEKSVEPKAVEVVKSFKVVPNKKLWMGYRDLKPNKYYQKIFLEELTLDPDKDWLLYLGHGNVSFEINGKMEKYHSVKNMRFLYKDNKLKEITTQEFKAINKDRKW